MRAPTRPHAIAAAGFPALLAKRTNVIAWMTSLVLLPLCMLKSFAPLAPFSILGILGTMFTAGVLALRLLDGSYAPGGKFYSVSQSVSTLWRVFDQRRRGRPIRCGPVNTAFCLRLAHTPPGA